MKKIYIIIGCLFFSGCLIGCSSTKTVERSCYKYHATDSTMFSDYYGIFFTDDHDKSIFVLSKKNKHEVFDESKFDNLEYGKSYCLNLIKADSLSNVKLSFEADRGGGGDIYMDKELFWKNGKIVVPVYITPDIRGVYAIKSRKNF